MPKVFLSHALDRERLLFGPRQPAAGSAGAWDTLAASYAAGLTACGWRVQPVVRPEIYSTDAARTVLGVEPGDWHLAVKPVEHLRPFHGIPNVFVCDEPPPEPAQPSPGGSPFAGLRLLRLAAAVLCPTAAAAEGVREAGIDRVVTIPPAAGVDAFAAALAELARLLATAAQ